MKTRTSTPTRGERLPSAQRGATLFVGLIMLLLLTLHAIAALHTGTTQLRIAGNVQDRRSAEAAAETAIGALISSPVFPDDPAGTASTVRSIDIDGNGSVDFDVALVAQCRSARALPPALIDPLAIDDIGCVGSSALGSSALCMLTQWDVQAVASVAGTSANTGARSEIHQGIAIRMPSSEAVPSC